MFSVGPPELEAGAGCENLTLSEFELECCWPIRTQDGQRLRAFCPFHGSDHQRSLAVIIETGRFHCFACGAWGYMESARKQWRKERSCFVKPRSYRRTRVESPRTDLVEPLRNYQEALPDGIGEAYLRSRGIDLALAQKYGLGYAASGRWIHQSRDWRSGRIVVPHTDSCGRLVSLYGRAVGSNDSVPKEFRHDHLPGGKGYFNAVAMRWSDSLFITEGPFDALSLIATGHVCAVAIFGVCGWRWDWARHATTLIFALDADSTGQVRWRELARQARLRGKRVAFLPPEAYGGHKDVNEAWIAGALNVSA
jgi:DNA primase